MIDRKKLAKGLSDCPGGTIFLIETTAPKMMDLHLAAMSWAGKKKYAQIVVSASRPSQNLLDLYKKNKIDVSKMTVICPCCQKNENGAPHEKCKVIHVRSCSALTDISLALSRCMESVKGGKFIFIDSIDTMLIHNAPTTLARFIHLILTKMRANHVSGVLLSSKLEISTEVRAEIAQLCDRIITL